MTSSDEKCPLLDGPAFMSVVVTRRIVLHQPWPWRAVLFVHDINEADFKTGHMSFRKSYPTGFAGHSGRPSRQYMSSMISYKVVGALMPQAKSGGALRTVATCLDNLE